MVLHCQGSLVTGSRVVRPSRPPRSGVWAASQIRQEPRPLALRGIPIAVVVEPSPKLLHRSAAVLLAEPRVGSGAYDAIPGCAMLDTVHAENDVERLLRLRRAGQRLEELASHVGEAGSALATVDVLVLHRERGFVGEHDVAVRYALKEAQVERLELPGRSMEEVRHDAARERKGNCSWVDQHHNVLVNGPTGVGKRMRASLSQGTSRPPAGPAWLRRSAT